MNILERCLCKFVSLSTLKELKSKYKLIRFSSFYMKIHRAHSTMFVHFQIFNVCINIYESVNESKLYCCIVLYIYSNKDF